MANFKFDALSYVGRRKNNQDSCFSNEISKGFYFLAVADGMGGAAGGEIASQAVIATAKSFLNNEPKSNIYPDNLKELLSQIFAKSQEAIALKIKQNPELAGMGTTLTCVLLYEDKYAYGNIGDSRVYLISKNEIKQITNDHTYIQEHINKHGDDIPEHFHKTYGHIITRSINGEDDKPELFPLDANYCTLNEGELFLLCSDGLITNKTEKDNSDFYEIIIGNKDLLKTLKNLISYAFSRGSTDNITAVIGEFGYLKRGKTSMPEYEYPPKNDQLTDNTSTTSNSTIDRVEEADVISENSSGKRKANSKKMLSVILIILTLLLVAIITGAYILFTEKPNKEEIIIVTEHNDESVKENEIKAVDFMGFEERKMELKLAVPTNIYWSKYPDIKGFKKYLIHERDGKFIDFTISSIGNTNINFNKLGIVAPGTYTLKIIVVLKNGKKVSGKKDLVITAK